MARGWRLAGPVMVSNQPHLPPYTAAGLGIIALSLSGGFAVGTLLGLGLSSFITAMVCASISYTSYGRNIESAFRRSLLTSTTVTLLAVLALITSGIPSLAAISMGVVAFVSSIGLNTSATSTAIGLLATPFYLAIAAFGLVFIKDQSTPVVLCLLATAVGTALGLLLTAIISMTLRIVNSSNVEKIPVHVSSIMTTMMLSIREFRRAPRDGIRRSIALGLSMFIFQTIPSHDGFLLIITAAVVLPVYGRVPMSMVGARLLGTFMAIGIALMLPFVLPTPVITLLAFLALAYSFATAFRSNTHSLAALCVTFLLFIGAPGSEFGIYAGWRLIDAAGGFIIATLIGYVLWPKQPRLVFQTPSHLHQLCEKEYLLFRNA